MGIIFLWDNFLLDIKSRQVRMFTSKFEAFVSNAYRLEPSKQGRYVNKSIVLFNAMPHFGPDSLTPAKPHSPIDSVRISIDHVIAGCR